MAQDRLPPEFRDLEPHLPWALRGESERRAKRDASTLDEIRVFYDAMLARMEAVLTFLESFPPDDPPAEVDRLFCLAAALAEVAPAIEMYGAPTGEGLDAARLRPIDIYPQRG